MKAELNELEKLLSYVTPTEQNVKRAMARALNETMRSFKAQMVKEASEMTQIQAKLFRERTAMLKASFKKLEGNISTIIVSIPAILLAARQNQQGVSVSGGRVFQRAFINKTKRGALAFRVFRRKYLDQTRKHGRYPIEEMRVPIADEVARAGDYVASKIDEKLMENFVRNLKVLTGVI